MTALHVLIVAGVDEAKQIDAMLDRTGVVLAMTHCAGIEAAIEHLQASFCEVALLGAARADCDELDSIEYLHSQAADTALVVVANLDDEAFRAAALERGAADCLFTRELDGNLLKFALRHAVSRTRLEREMRAREAQLRELFDLNPHPMWVYDAETLEFIAVNHVAIQLYGYSEQEFLSMTIADIRSPAEAERLRKHIDQGLPALGPTGVWRHRRKDGSEIEVEIHAQAVPLWGSNARLVQARNVTAERRAIRALEISERRFRDLFEHSTGYICIHDLDGALLSINPATANALGRSVAELLGTPLRDMAPPELHFQVDDYVQRIVRNGEDAGLMRVIGKDGAELVWQYRNRVYADADGASYVMGYAQDITALRAAERAVERSERRLRTIADALPLMIAYIDAQERFVFANEAYRRTRPGGEIIGRYLSDVLGSERYARRQPFIDRAMAGERVVFEDEDDGEADDYRCVEITLIPEPAENGSGALGVYAMLQDITSKKREEKRLIRLTLVDHLTGLLNRVGFYEHLDSALARSRDQKSLLAVFYLDIDRFKQVNDTYGHAVGDALMRALAARLGEKVRASDIVARLGGDEFTVIMEGIPDAAHIRAIAAKLVASMRRPFELRGEGLTLSVGTSIGVALCRAAPLTAAELVARADAALYEAKQGGRNTYRLTTITQAEPGKAQGRA